MTTRHFLLAALRWWWIVLLGLALTSGTALLLASRMPVVYTARTTVTVLPPYSNPFRADTTAINGLAVILVTRANGGTTTVKTSSPETTLYGEGVRDGSRIRVRDTGGQWAAQIAEPVIYVEAVGPTPEFVAERIERNLSELQADLESLQADLGASVGGSAILRVTPESPVVERVTGNRNRFLASYGVTGVAVTGVAVFLVDRSRLGDRTPRGVRSRRRISSWPATGSSRVCRCGRWRRSRCR